MRAVDERERTDTLAATLFHATGVDGVYARTETYERIVEALGALITAHRPAGAEVLRFPPVMSRRDLERHGYLKSFPDLLGCVSCLRGSAGEIRQTIDRFDDGEPWTGALAPTDLVLSPAACYPVYPIVAARGPAPRRGLCFDVAGDCFRHEPSRDIDRLQSFRMREFVTIGTPEHVQAFRADWIEQAQNLAADLGLPHQVNVATDPFMGGSIVARIQKHLKLKFELQIPIRSEEEPTACMSFNYHRDHFGHAWGITTADGEVAHSGCVAFGIDRLALALFATHGVDPVLWPGAVRNLLKL